MSYRLVDANKLALKYPEVNDMPCIYADLDNGLDGGHYDLSAQRDDCISRNDVIEMLNTMDRYTADKLKLCDTDKEFPHNEVFIVDDVYEGLDLLPSAENKGEWIESKERSGHWYCSVCGGIHTDPETGKWREIFDYKYPFCPNCGARMKGGE